MKEDKLPVESLWSRHSGLLSLLVAVVVSLIGVVLDRLLLKEGLPRLDMLIFSNGLTGLFAGGLFYQMAREARASRALVEERMKTIAETQSPHPQRAASHQISGLAALRAGRRAIAAD